MPPQTEAFFLPADGDRPGQRFCLFHPAQGDAPKGSVLYVHPFAEEMNKSRRMAALQSRALAQAGYAVLQIDLLGCGDSSGDFGDATWQGWVGDVVQGCHWLQGRSHAPTVANPDNALPLWLWGLRAGCLLAAEAASQLATRCNFLFWQPPPAGKQLLQQFLRLKVAGDMLGGQSKGVMEGMRQQLASGNPVEIAGYSLSAGLASGLEQAVLLPLPSHLDPQQRVLRAPSAGMCPEQETLPPPPVDTGQTLRLEWLELSTREDASFSPASAKTIAQWQQAGIDVRSHIVNGPAFWQTTEIEEAPALIAATMAALASTSASTEISLRSFATPVAE